MEEAKAHLKEHGWVKIPSVLPKDEAAHILERLWKAKAASEAHGEDTFQPILDPDPTNVRVFYLPMLDNLFLDMLREPTGLEMTQSVLGEKLLVSNFSANIARPGSKSMALHSDQSIVTPEPWLDIWAVNVIYCLTRMTKENGATLYIPGSNKWTRWEDVPANAPDLLVPFEADAGDIVVIDGRLWHTSGSNVTKDEDRAILFAYYSAPYMRPLVNWSAKLPREFQDKLIPELKEMLGLSHVGYHVYGDLRYMDDKYPKKLEEKSAITDGQPAELEAFSQDYNPSTRIAELPANAPIADILSMLNRDGGIILTNLVSTEQLISIEKELEPHIRKDNTQDESFFKGLVPQETLLIGGLVGKSPTLASICEKQPVLEQLRQEILTNHGTRKVEGYDLPYHIDPLLSCSLSFRVRYGAERQRLHRDDGTHLVEHKGEPYRMDREAQFGVLIAGVETTQANGATMFVVGSHRWDDKRKPKLEEVTFAEMKPGSALIFLASCWHGAGHNSVPGFTRVQHGLFFVRGTMRTQENQFLAVPRGKALTMSPKMLSLLGYKQPTAALGMVENGDPMEDLAGAIERANM
ncbi:MAG: hypothetical protein Q9174_000593 [Haloplaca sp. 1 TL-2023]